jgi:hypothetical protein
MAATVHEGMTGAVGRGVARPFRSDADDLVAMFQTLDAGTPAWHRARARTLQREAKLQPVAAVTNAWSRLAARHIATAMLLESQQSLVPPPAGGPVARRRRFFRTT